MEMKINILTSNTEIVKFLEQNKVKNANVAGWLHKNGDQKAPTSLHYNYYHLYMTKVTYEN